MAVRLMSRNTRNVQKKCMSAYYASLFLHTTTCYCPIKSRLIYDTIFIHLFNYLFIYLFIYLFEHTVLHLTGGVFITTYTNHLCMPSVQRNYCLESDDA